MPAVVTKLAVGCRRKIVLYSWRDGEPQDVQVSASSMPRCDNAPTDIPSVCSQEIAALAHSPRAMAFVNGETLCWGHTPSDYCVTALKTSVTVDVVTPIPTTTSGSGMGPMGMGALSGLGGYMTLGLGAKAKPNVVGVREDEALVAKDSEYYFQRSLSTPIHALVMLDAGFIVGAEGKAIRSEPIDWPAPPDELGLFIAS